VSERDIGMQARRDEIDARAREWLSYLYSGEMSEEGRAGFQAWLARSPDHRAAFEMLNGIWASLDLVPRVEEGLIERSRDFSKVTGRPLEGRVQSGWRRAWQITALAAGLAAMAILATLMLADPVDEYRFSTGIGEVRTVGLTDGTQIVLRADTEIAASMSRKKRSVTIERGGAYFDVFRDEARPFVVSAAGIDVRVRGTAFDVLKGPRSVTVSVTRGRVAVSDLTARNRSDAHTVELIGAQQLKFESDGTFGAITEFDPEQVLGWREGRLSYVNARLLDIVADVNRYRAVKIGIQDPALENLRITTTFRVENADQMLAGVEATEPVTIVRSPSSITVQQRENP
jgi:transmembrane sensor